MTPETVEIIGYAAGTVTACSIFPQVLKSWKSKSTKDISLLYNLLLFIGLALWILYGYHSNSTPILVFASIEEVFTGSLIFLKLKYK